MAKIKFSDGMEFDTSGPYRVVRKSDGYYVVGEGMLCAVDSREDGEAQIAELKAIEANANRIDGYDRDDLGESPDF